MSNSVQVVDCQSGLHNLLQDWRIFKLIHFEVSFCFCMHEALLGYQLSTFFVLDYQHAHCFHLVPGNVSNVTHNVMISGDEILIKITFQVSWFLYDHAWLHTCEIVAVYLI